MIIQSRSLLIRGGNRNEAAYSFISIRTHRGRITGDDTQIVPTPYSLVYLRAWLIAIGYRKTSILTKGARGYFNARCALTALVFVNVR